MPLPLAGQSLQPDVARGGDARGRPAARAPPGSQPRPGQPARGAAGPGSQHEEPQARAASTRSRRPGQPARGSRRPGQPARGAAGAKGAARASRRMTGARNGRRGIVINRLVSCQRHQTVDHERGAQAVGGSETPWIMPATCVPHVPSHPPVIMGLVGPKPHQSHDHGARRVGGRGTRGARREARSPGPGVPDETDRRTGGRGKAGAGRRGGRGPGARGSRLAARGSRLAARGSQHGIHVHRSHVYYFA